MLSKRQSRMNGEYFGKVTVHQLTIESMQLYGFFLSLIFTMSIHFL